MNRVISLNPRFRGYPYRVDFVNVNNVHRVKILSVSIPNTAYIVNNHNNKLEFSNGLVELAPGYYNTHEFKNELETKLKQIYNNAEVFLNERTMKLTIVLNTTSILELNEAAQLLTGLNPHTQLTNTFKAARTIFLNSSPVYYLRMKGVNSNVDIKYGSHVVLNNKVQRGDILYYDSGDNIFNMPLSMTSNMNSIEFDLLDVNGYRVDLNNDFCNIVLQLEHD